MPAAYPSTFGPAIRALFPWLGAACIVLLLSFRCFALSTLAEVHVLGSVPAGHKRVTLLDLVDRGTVPDDWQLAMSAVDIGEAPPPGQQKYIDPGNLKPFLCQFIESQGTASSRVAMHLPERIVVERKTMEISQGQVEEVFREFLQGRAPWGREEMTIQNVTSSGIPSLPSGEMTYEVIASPREKFAGNVTVTVHFFVDGEKVCSTRVTGRVDLYRDVVQLNRALQKNETIREGDLEIQRIHVGDSPDRYITRPEQVIHKRVVRNVEPHQPLEAKDLDKALVLRRGDMVTIVYNDPGLKLTAKGRVREDGCLGDHIRIHNVSTNKVVICRVLDAQTVQATQ